MMMSEGEIIDRLKTAYKQIGTSDTDIFGSNVPEKTTRVIIALFVHGDGTSVTVDIKEKAEDGTYSIIIPGIPVGPAAVVPYPEQNYSVKDPLMSLTGGKNLAGMTSSGNNYVVVVYWDKVIK